ncbi:acyl-CoA-binding protein [Piscirickettsia litoralis]|uniref:Acyl-CoA-binding protein n=1 Tax=Piscirickettsia litoralis TaxID=1891921 RepID=A0ABX3A5V6_9GAMM|nr:acyl-CoA-binding protein [Piscirickettsia litoralis]ODN43920.1 acyl-CoA-binding protein [Piscirickettsia litoralis]
METLEQQFNKAVEDVQSGAATIKPTNANKLALYALFKQVEQGDVIGEKPGMTDFVARAKYSAWEKLKGVGREDAMKRYIEKSRES